MWRLLSVRCWFLLSRTLVICTSALQKDARDSLLFSLPITVDGNTETLNLFQGESYEDAAITFANSKGIMQLEDKNHVRRVIDQLTTLLKEHADQAQLDSNVQDRIILLTLPLTIDGASTELLMYEGDTSKDAIDRYFDKQAFTAAAQQQLMPQLMVLVEKRLQEIQPPQKEEFSFQITIDDEVVTVRHFAGGNPREEAEEVLRFLKAYDASTIARLVPQIEREIIRRSNMDSSEANVQGQTSNSPKSQTPKALFSIPLTMENAATELIHYEEFTAEQSALQFLIDNGVVDESVIRNYLPQLVQAIESRMASVIQDEVAPAETVQPLREEPFVALRIQLSGHQEAFLKYFDGDNIEQTVRQFLRNVNLENDPKFEENLAQLTKLLQEKVSLRLASEKRQTPLYSFPVNIQDAVYQLQFFAGQEPSLASTTFCVESYESNRRDRGIDFNDDQLLECKSTVEAKLLQLLGRAAEIDEHEKQEVETEAKSSGQQTILFTIDIDVGNDRILPLEYRRDEDPEGISRAFCAEHSIGDENVPALVQAIQNQLAAL